MKMCSIDGCSRQHVARGFCKAHYKRLKRHGDPLSGRTPAGDCTRFLQDNKDYAGAECLIWPYSTDSAGYGRLGNKDGWRGAHVLMLEMTAGPKPTPEHECAHSCGKGHKGCVNPRHLRWATPSENAMDKLPHGTHIFGERHGRAKLTDNQVLEIRELLAQGTSQDKIAETFGVSQASVSLIRHRKRWAWLEDRAAGA